MCTHVLQLVQRNLSGGSAMHTTTVREARNNLARLLRLVGNGDEVVIRNRRVPVAKLVPYKAPAKKGFPDLTSFRNKMSANRKLEDSTGTIRFDRDARG